MLDNGSNVMNSYSGHELGTLGADEFYVMDNFWATYTNVPYQKNAYIWAEDVYQPDETVPDWDRAYLRILYSNTVLDGLEEITPATSDVEAWNNARGSALFYRAFTYYQMAQLFCEKYDHALSRQQLGLPLRLTADITLHVPRASLYDTYALIIRDLEEAFNLLPIEPLSKFRPSRPAVLALFARIHLQLEDYENAKRYADGYLSYKNELLDFSNLDVERTTFNIFDNIRESNPELVFSCYYAGSFSGYWNMVMSPELLSLYPLGDVRKQAYFHLYNNNLIFRGSYSANGAFFTGLATDEVLLIHAETSARLGLANEARSSLQKLEDNRVNEGHRRNFDVLSNEELLDLILLERRKELVFRGTRWEDLRRLNTDERYQIVLSRELGGQSYHLYPNDNRYVWPIPKNAVDLGGYEQNKR